MGCPICDSTKERTLYSNLCDLEHSTDQVATYIECSNCFHLYQSSINRSLFYPVNYRANSKNRIYRFLKNVHATYLAKNLANHLGDLNVNILELGCGQGELLFALSRLGYNNLDGVDWECPGLTSQANSNIRFNKIDIELFETDKLYDYIVLHNVIEHFYNLTLLIKKYSAFLKENGKFIVYTPNNKCLSRSVFGKYWSGLHSPWHYHVFSKKSIELFADKMEFIISYASINDSLGTWIFSFLNFYKSCFTKKSSVKQRILGLIAPLSIVFLWPLYFFSIYFERGSSIFIIIRKN